MKKIIKFIVYCAVLFLIIIQILFYTKKITPSLKYNYFLLFKQKINIKTDDISIFNPYIRYFKNIHSKDLFIENFRLNLLNQTAYIKNVYITFDFYKKIKELVNYLDTINIPIKKLYIQNLNIIGEKEDYLLNFSSILTIDSLTQKIQLSGSGFLNKNFVFINFDINKGKKFKLIFNAYNKNSLNSITQTFNLNFPEFASKLNFEKSQLIFSGIIGDEIYGKLRFKMDNFFIIADIKVKNNKTIIKNGKIFYGENEENFEYINKNYIKFKGEVADSNIYSFVFDAKNISMPILKEDFSIKDTTFELLLTKDLKDENIILKLISNKLKFSNLEKFLSFFTIKNFSYKAQITNLLIDNIELNNVDFFVYSTDHNLSIEKFNFDLNSGKFLFSYITSNNNFQIAIDIKRTELSRLLKLIYKNPTFNGLFNLTFIGEGKNKIFSSGKGYFSSENFEIKGITIEKLINDLKDSDISTINFYKLDNSTESIKFKKFNGIIKVSNKQLKLKKIIATDFKNNYSFILKGILNLNNLNNLILSGNLFYHQKPIPIIININFEKKFLQIIKKD